jgi:pilus assembly protein CpaB
MNQRVISVLVFVFIGSAGAGLLLRRLCKPVTTEAQAAFSELIVAARDLEPSTLIRDTDLRVGRSNGNISAGVLRRKEDIVGRSVIHAIYAGEPLVESRMAHKIGVAAWAALIPKGMRAVAIRANEVGAADFAVPGMRVDVLVMGVPPGGAQGRFARTLLQNVQVLSATPNFQQDAEGKPASAPVVSLLVTPKQAEVLVLASTQTRVQLVLRNPQDSHISQTTGSVSAQLFH